MTAAGNAFHQGVINCYEDAWQKCLAHDASQAFWLFKYLALLQSGITAAPSSGLTGSVDETKPWRCAHFRLEFDSELCLSYTPVAPTNCPNILMDVSALDTEFGGSIANHNSGQGPMSLTKAVGPNEAATSGGSTFDVVTGAVLIRSIGVQNNLPVFEPQVDVVIQPGYLTEHWTSDSGSFDANLWANRFCAIHVNELVGHPAADQFTCVGGNVAASAQYRIDGWQILGGELYAQKSYYRTYGAVLGLGGDAQPQGGPPPYGWEITTLKLYHEPQQ